MMSWSLVGEMGASVAMVTLVSPPKKVQQQQHRSRENIEIWPAKDRFQRQPGILPCRKANFSSNSSTGPRQGNGSFALMDKCASISSHYSHSVTNSMDEIAGDCAQGLDVSIGRLRNFPAGTIPMSHRCGARWFHGTRLLAASR